MSLGGGYTVLRSFSAVGSESSPTTSSSFVHPEGHIPGADSIEVAFDEVTKDTSGSVTVELWLRTRDAGGTRRVIPYSTSLATFSAAGTTDTTGRVQFKDVPAGDWYPIARSVTQGTFTGVSFIRAFNSVDE